MDSPREPRQRVRRGRHAGLMDKLSEEESRMPGVMFLATGAEEVGTAG